MVKYNTVLTTFLKNRSGLTLLIAGAALIGLGDSIVNSILNNFLNESFSISSFQRTFMELPRELPGFLVVFISAALFFLRSRRLAVFAALASSVGLLLIAFASPTFHVFMLWIFLYSMGQHLLMPLNNSIAMELAQKGKDGRRLGQMNSVRNIATILGSFVVFLGFTFLHIHFSHAFFAAALLYVAASIVYISMEPGKAHSAKLRLTLHKEYKHYYWLSILFGTRKQIFLTFAPWVLVSVYHQPTTMLATLLTIGGISGIIFQPILGHAIDKLGEKVVLIAEAVVLLIICLGYAFSSWLFTPQTAFIVSAACYVIDLLLMSVNMARTTYMKKIAKHPDHITPALTMALTMDHVFSIGVALVGGVIWMTVGFQVVFLFGGLIALVNFISALFVKIPKELATGPSSG